MKKIKLNIINEVYGQSKSPVVAKTQEEKILLAWIKEMARPKLGRGEYVGMEWSDEERNYASMDQFKGGVISAALGRIVKALDIENPPDSYREINNERLRVAEWVYATVLYGHDTNATPKLRRTNNPDPRYGTLLHSDNFMSSYDTFNPYAKGTLNKRGKWFIRLWRQICHFASYIVEVREGAAKYTVPRDRQGRPMSDRAFRNMMKRDLRKLSKRDRLGPIERALYDMNPDNKRGLLEDMVVAILDPRGPWGYAGRNQDGEAITNWDAFKESVMDLKKVRNVFDLQWGMGMVALNGLGLIPFVPSPSKAGGAGARGISRAVKMTKGANAEAAKMANRMKKAAAEARKAGELSKAQKAKVVSKADEILAVTKHNDAILAKYPGGKVCVKKGGLKESKKKNLNEQNVFCICPPYQIDDFGRLVDPEVNPKAYGLGPGDEILYGADGNVYAQTRRVPDQASQGARQASRGASQASRGASQAGIGSMRFTNNRGAPAGVLKFDGRTMVRVMVDGTPVTFLKGSGTSQVRIIRGADGRAKQIVPMEIAWYPIGDVGSHYQNTLGKVKHYPKKGAEDPKFNFEGPDGRNIPHPDMQGGQIAQYTDEFNYKMTGKYGEDWPRKMLDNHEISDDVIAGFRSGEIYPITRRVDKWPHPESEYGKIASQINAADEAGRLEDVFGKAAKMDVEDGPSIIRWEKGELDAREAAHEFNRNKHKSNLSGDTLYEESFSKRLIDIVEEEIRAVINEKT